MAYTKMRIEQNLINAAMDGRMQEAEYLSNQLVASRTGVNWPDRVSASVSFDWKK